MSITQYNGGYILGGVSNELPDWLGSYNQGVDAAVNQQTARLNQQEAKQRMSENAAAEARRAAEFGWKADDRARDEAYWAGQGKLPGLQTPQGPGLGPMPMMNIPAPIAPSAGLMEQGATPVPASAGSTDLVMQLLPEWARMEQSAGLPNNYLETVSMLESSGGTNTGNGQYVGVFQIGPEVAADFGVTPEQLKDPRINSQIAAKLAGRNAAGLRGALGREPQGWEIYLAHQQGLGGATALLRAPTANVVDALASAYGGDRTRAQQAVLQNGGDPRMTAGQFAQLWQTKFSGGRPQPFTGGPGVAVPPSDLTPKDNPNLSPILNDVADANTAARRNDVYYSLLSKIRSNPIGDAASYLFSSQDTYNQRQQSQAVNSEALSWFQSKEVTDYLYANPDALAAAERDPVAFYQQYKGAITAAAPAAGVAETVSAKGDLPAGLATDGTMQPAPAAPAVPTMPSAAAETPMPAPAALGAPSGEVVPPVTREDYAGLNAPGQGSIAQQIMRTPTGQQTALPDSGQYMVEPAKINSDMFELTQLRKQLEANYADAVQYRDREGMLAIKQKAVEVDAAIRLLQNMQSIAALQGGDVNKVSQTLSRLTNGQVRIQPRSDGKYNVFFNGRQTYDGVTQEALIAALRMEYDQQYQSQVAAALKQQDEIGMKVLESQLKTNEAIQTRTADALKQQAIDNNKARLEQMFPQTNVVTGNLPDGSTGFYAYPQNGGPPVIYTLKPKLTVSGEQLVDAAGNPSYGLVEYGKTNSVPVQ